MNENCASYLSSVAQSLCFRRCISCRRETFSLVFPFVARSLPSFLSISPCTPSLPIPHVVEIVA